MEDVLDRFWEAVGVDDDVEEGVLCDTLFLVRLGQLVVHLRHPLRRQVLVFCLGLFFLEDGGGWRVGGKGADIMLQERNMLGVLASLRCPPHAPLWAAPPRRLLFWCVVVPFRALFSQWACRVDRTLGGEGARGRWGLRRGKRVGWEPSRPQQGRASAAGTRTRTPSSALT